MLIDSARERRGMEFESARLGLKALSYLTVFVESPYPPQGYYQLASAQRLPHTELLVSSGIQVGPFSIILSWYHVLLVHSALSLWFLLI